MSATTHGAKPYYFVPQPSRHPAFASFGLLLVIFGAAQWINGVQWGMYVLAAGMVWWLFVLSQWFGEAIGESESGQYGHKIDLSFRWSMSWFIFSEVMFFGAFFAALWWARSHSVPALGNLDNALLWPDFKSAWPSMVPGATTSPADTIEPFTAMVPLGSAPAEVWKASFIRGVFGSVMASLPTLNTALLLTSGVTITVAHHALIAGNRSRTIAFMWMTVVLGLIFLFVQGYEYHHAYDALNLKLSSGMYGSTFYLLTGFHGFHVFVGMLMLFFITLRLMKGHFTPERHFGFEGAAWYWHFVDVVWLGLYILVYWL
ncbi:MAG: cytochrome c oxidase subunit 3 [Bdellovibrionales bacterium]|nr:cytochrome c oxidase subunit 3 [Ramlibacter sp.]